MMLLGAHFKLNLKLSACENLIKTDLMTGKLLKDPEVPQEEEGHVAVNEAVHCPPCLRILGTASCRIFPQGEALSADGLVARSCHYSGNGAWALGIDCFKEVTLSLCPPPPPPVNSQCLETNACYEIHACFKNCAHLHGTSPGIPRPLPMHAHRHAAQLPKFFGGPASRLLIVYY